MMFYVALNFQPDDVVDVSQPAPNESTTQQKVGIGGVGAKSLEASSQSVNSDRAPIESIGGDQLVSVK